MQGRAAADGHVPLTFLIAGEELRVAATHTLQFGNEDPLHLALQHLVMPLKESRLEFLSAPAASASGKFPDVLLFLLEAVTTDKDHPAVLVVNAGKPRARLPAYTTIHAFPPRPGSFPHVCTIIF